METTPAHLRFMTSAEVAEILKMHPQVINRKLQAGDLQGYKIGKDWRISEAQLMAFLESRSNQRPKPTKETKTLTHGAQRR